jgi:hypothetical protein
MGPSVYCLCRISTTRYNRKLQKLHRAKIKNFFLNLPINRPRFQNLNLHQRLLMVGPASSEWKVLRATDGERFVVICKDMIFSRDLLSVKTK